MSIERQAVSALKWTTAARLLGQAFTWGVTLVVVRLLAPEDYGLMAITSAVATVLLTVADLGLGASLVQAPELERAQLESVAGVMMLLNLGIGALILALAPATAAVFDEPRLTAVVAASSLQFALLAVGAVPQALAQRGMDFRLLALVELASGVGASAVTLVLAWSGGGVWSLVAGNLSGAAIRTLWLIADRGLVRPSLRLEGVGGHARFGGALTVSRLVWQVVSQADVFVAGRLLGQQALGTYSVSLNLATLPMQKIMGIVNQVALPTIARLQDDRERLRGRLIEAVRLLTFVSVPVAWGLSSVAPEFTALVLGEKWHAAIAPLQVIALVVPVRMFAATMITSVAALGGAGTDLRNTLVTAACLPPAFWVGSHWGVVGLASAWLVASPAILLINFPSIERVTGIPLAAFARRVYPSVLAGAAMFGCVSALRGALPPLPVALALAVLVPAGALVYLGLVSLLDRSIWLDVRRLARAARA